MSSYAEQRTAALRANSKQIRARSSQMERDVAKFLSGRRVPYSGAGAMKGDCEVETEKIGKIFIECKYSASRHNIHGSRIRLDFRWFDKMQRDAELMHAKFPALVIKFHDQRLSTYVIVSTSVLTLYDTADRVSGAVSIDVPETKRGFTLLRILLETTIASHTNGSSVALFRCNRGEFAIMPIAIFKEIIHGTFDSLESTTTE